MSESFAGVILSDLDGTFLDDEFRPVLKARAFHSLTAAWRVVWVSSRTAEEILALQNDLRHAEDAIGETGGVCVTRSPALACELGPSAPLGDAWVSRLGSPRAQVDELVRQAFGDNYDDLQTMDRIGATELARLSGYDVAAAQRALARRTSVLIREDGRHDERMDTALASLHAAGCAVSHGGRWLSIVHGADKGLAVREWLSKVVLHSHARPWPVVAIGNADNDAPLLEAADLRFVIRDPVRGHLPRLASIAGARLLRSEGTAGWPEMMRVLERLAQRAA